ncbi:hypothetical protein [Myxococcus fulvus]|uniref:hypothetical protein n=1 Tax=Myxococcus fulvus TaxID=33 RepID=UPI0020C00B3C|nr:hypothetical protein [Myxococcus fulvus]MCK8498422.1 hypothetical protein [Myxococcus fulvus]
MPGPGAPLISEHTEPADALRRVAAWYFANVYGKAEGPGTLPFYSDPSRVGAFAVEPSELARGESQALFRLFVALSMFQALRDVVIMRQQRTMTAEAADSLASSTILELQLERHDCEHLSSADLFESRCDVHKCKRGVDCRSRPGTECHVKTATALFRRMGDMGKLPTSAWLRAWKDGALARVLAVVHRGEPDPQRRAEQLVEHFAQVHRVGRKLATLFVSALSTPALAPGLTPWAPDVDGNRLIVVDTNVARAVDALRPPGAIRSYEARAAWLREQAAQVDLREFRGDVPACSPRLVQQALYHYCSKSNREAQGLDCRGAAAPCEECTPSLCPLRRAV